MGKGSKRRPGKGYEENYDRIFKKPKDKTPEVKKDESTDRRRRTTV